jgi:hypothetical protein
MRGTEQKRIHDFGGGNPRESGLAGGRMMLKFIPAKI